MTQTVDRGTRVADLAAAADRIRHHILDMGEVQGQGYVGQGLGFADVLAVIYKDLTTYRPEDPHWVDRDRVLLSMGHYAIAEYAALAEAGILPVEELDTYGSDDSRLPMSGMSTYTPGMEISGGSLGHGLGVAVGMALGLRFQGNAARVINMMSDGELDEGSTWEAAMAASHHGLGNLLCVVDMNGLQADGPTAGVLRTEPVVDKWAAFGWRTVRVDGNDINALVDAFDSVPAGDSPAVVICDTRIGRGVPFLETREKAHFIRIDETRMGPRPPGAARRQPRWEQLTMTTTNTHQRPHRAAAAAADAEVKPAKPVRAKTSAMIASIADAGQKTAPAPLGHALVEAGRAEPEGRRAVRGPGQVHRHAHLPGPLPGAVLPGRAWPSSCCSAPPPGWPRPG